MRYRERKDSPKVNNYLNFWEIFKKMPSDAMSMSVELTLNVNILTAAQRQQPKNLSSQPNVQFDRF